MRYITTAETAALIRKLLKKKYPKIKFTVLSNKGSRAINVSWTDGPALGDIDALVKGFEGSDFDGSIDMQISNLSWLLPDGTACIASTSGTTGNKGFIKPVDIPAPCDNAELVRFMADYVFTRRIKSKALVESALMEFLIVHGPENAKEMRLERDFCKETYTVRSNDQYLEDQFYIFLSRYAMLDFGAMTEA